jgi:tetratricopeptide (TPR) repeat protein
VTAQRKKTVAGAAGAAVVLGALLVWTSRRAPAGPSPPRPAGSAAEPARFVGREACAPCHRREEELFRGSDHDLAMAVADETTVLGDFGGRRFTSSGVTSTFFRRDGKFLVRTDGPGGKLREYEVAYTFGVYPLQQYLIAFPGGRYQALGIAWDSRPREQGGQRWFHLYPSERIAHDDPLHWTGPYQNWNFMCAECHSTGLSKGYRPDEDRYETTWSEIDVSCEACHGPGSAHVAWGKAVEAGLASRGGPDGLVVHLKDPARDAFWEFDIARGIARRSAPRTSWTELETCARCHARRSLADEDYVHGRPLLDTHRPALLDDPLYYPDGQIQDEVYEYGPFLQSRMHQEGVTCSDCHDPHSLAVPVSPDAVCSRCHLQEKFNTPAHHFHKPRSEGARCVECHMPARRYMVVDPRRDHSFRVPRPDLSMKIGVPNACNQCHRDRPARWAAEAAARWWRPGKQAEPHYGEAIHAGRAALAGAEGLLARLAGDTSRPAIVRATALSLLRRYPSPRSRGTVERSLRDPDPLVRLAALGPAADLPPPDRVRLVVPLLADPVRAVRADAARALALQQREELTPEQQAAFATAFAEWQRAQAANLDRAEGRLNLGVLAAQQRRLEDARREYEAALRLNPWLPPVYINLADLFRQKGRDDEGEKLLRRGLAVQPKDADLHYALGLLLVREKRLGEALASLERAAALRPEDAGYSYVFAIALQSAGQIPRALSVLERAHREHPGDAQVLQTLAILHRDRGEVAEAAAYARKLVEAVPHDPGARRLLREMLLRELRGTDDRMSPQRGAP